MSNEKKPAALAMTPEMQDKFLQFLAEQQSQTNEILQKVLKRDERAGSVIEDREMQMIEAQAYREPLVEGPKYPLAILKPELMPVMRQGARGVRIGGAGTGNKDAASLGEGTLELPPGSIAIGLEVQAKRPRGCDVFEWFVINFIWAESDASREERRKRLHKTLFGGQPLQFPQPSVIEQRRITVEKNLVWEDAGITLGVNEKLKFSGHSGVNNGRQTRLGDVAHLLTFVGCVESERARRAALGVDEQFVRQDNAPIWSMAPTTLEALGLDKGPSVSDVAASRQKLAKEALGMLDLSKQEIR